MLTSVPKPRNDPPPSYNTFTALKGSKLQLLFAVIAAGVMPCGSPKRSPRTSSIVQIIFSLWSFEISEGILRN